MENTENLFLAFLELFVKKIQTENENTENSFAFVNLFYSLMIAFKKILENSYSETVEFSSKTKNENKNEDNVTIPNRPFLLNIYTLI